MKNFRDIKRQCTEFTDVYSQYVANQQRRDDIFQEITEAKGKAGQADGALKEQLKEQLTLKYNDLQKTATRHETSRKTKERTIKQNVQRAPIGTPI